MSQIILEDVKNMGMVDLAHNQFFVKDGEAWNRDFEREISCRNLVREIIKKQNIEVIEELMTDDDTFDEIMCDWLQYGTDDICGIIAMYYSAMWGMADIRETLKEELQVISTEDTEPVKMIEFEGGPVPEELCTIDREGGADDFIGCSNRDADCNPCDGDCSNCVIDRIFKDYARLIGQKTDKKQIKYKPKKDYCKCGVLFLDHNTNYCGNCGQKLDWSGEE